MSHDDLAWLVLHHFKTLTRREYDWVFEFDQDVSLVATCLWRLVEAGRIRLTNQDDGHQFGLPAPVDALNEVNHRLARASVEAVELRQGTLDLDLHFSTGVVLQFIPDSSGYESWSLSGHKRRFIAVGGGRLDTLSDDPADR